MYTAQCRNYNKSLSGSSAGARVFKVGGLNLKAVGQIFFIDFSPGKACRA